MLVALFSLFVLVSAKTTLYWRHIRRVATCKPGKPGLTSFSETLALFFIQFLSFRKMKLQDRQNGPSGLPENTGWLRECLSFGSFLLYNSDNIKRNLMENLQLPKFQNVCEFVLIVHTLRSCNASLVSLHTLWRTESSPLYEQYLYYLQTLIMCNSKDISFQ